MRFPSSLGNSPAKRAHRSSRSYHGPRISKSTCPEGALTCQLVFMEIKLLQIDQFPEFFRDGTCMKRVQLPHSLMELSTDSEQLTVEAAVGHIELLEVRESAPFRRNSTSKLVRSLAILRVATSQNKNLKRRWEHLWQRSCANITSISKSQRLSAQTGF